MTIFEDEIVNSKTFKRSFIKRPTDSTTGRQTDTMSGQTSTTSRQMSTTSGQTSTTSRRRVLRVTRQVIP